MYEWKKVFEACQRLNFPEESISYFEDCFNRLIQSPTCVKKLEEAEKTLYVTYTSEDTRYLELLQNISKDTGILQNSVNLLFYLLCIESLKQKYHENGLPDELLWDTLQDLRYKLIECKNLYGHWGTFTPTWFRRYYLRERFAFGRLQFETTDFPYDDYKGLLKRGDIVYNCHIPSSGPLREEDVSKSLKQAYDFYKPSLKNGVMPIVCASWLLYEPFEEAFEGCENLKKFRALFDIVENCEKPSEGDFWRIFNVEYSPEILKNIATTTRMQKNMKEYLLQGKRMGYGFGVLLFDGEKIINK